METKATLPTMKEITNNYLYGQDNTPTEEERLDLEKILSNKERKLYVDVNKFMNKQNEPGRFITARTLRYSRNYNYSGMSVEYKSVFYL